MLTNEDLLAYKLANAISAKVMRVYHRNLVKRGFIKIVHAYTSGNAVILMYRIQDGDTAIVVSLPLTHEATRIAYEYPRVNSMQAAFNHVISFGRSCGKTVFNTMAGIEPIHNKVYARKGYGFKVKST